MSDSVRMNLMITWKYSVSRPPSNLVTWIIMYLFQMHVMYVYTFTVHQLAEQPINLFASQCARAAYKYTYFKYLTNK